MGKTSKLIQQYQIRLGSEPQEECWAVYLDTQAQIVGDFCVAKGSLARVQIHPRDVFRNAIALNAYALILIHNHPSGNLTPSKSDLKTAKQMVICGTLVQIHVQDFIIVNQVDYCSLLLHYDVSSTVELLNL